MSFPSSQLAIILPTYNESQNLNILLDKLCQVIPKSSVIIVDDSNHTENKKIRKIAQKYHYVKLLTRQKKLGRGSAVLAGFAEALKSKQFQYFVEMDTDLAHDPNELPNLYNAIGTQNADLVIGSRYILNSKIVDWPMRRLLLSKLINFSLNFWLGLNLHDYTNGYRMYKREAIEYLVKMGLQEKNFIALSESAYILKRKGFKMIEIPITFTDRKNGESTVGIRELFLCLLGAIRLRFREIK